MRGESELGSLTGGRNGGPSPGVGVFVPVRGLGTAGALPAGSELAAGSPGLPGRAVALLHGSSSRCDWEDSRGRRGLTPGQHRESSRNDPALGTRQSDFRPVERLPAAAGALPVTSLQRGPGLGERITESYWEPLDHKDQCVLKTKQKFLTQDKNKGS